MLNVNVALIKQGLIGIAVDIKAGIAAKILAVKTKLSNLFKTKEDEIHAKIQADIDAIKAKLGM